VTTEPNGAVQKLSAGFKDHAFKESASLPSDRGNAAWSEGRLRRSRRPRTCSGSISRFP